MKIGEFVFLSVFFFLALSGGLFWWMPKVFPIEPITFLVLMAIISAIISALVVVEKV